MKVYKIEQHHPTSERGIEWGESVFSALRLIHPMTKRFDQKFSDGFFKSFFYKNRASIESLWQSPEIEVFKYKNFPLPDIGRIAGQTSVHIFSEEAVKRLGQYIDKDGVFLPFTNKNNLRYSWFYILSNIDALLVKSNENDYISYFEKYEFDAPKLEGIYIFNIKNHPGTFATDLFVDLVNAQSFKGLMFQLIWDSENPDYVDERFKPEVWAEIKARYAKRNT
jgi:hypothetical protein